MQNGYCYSNNLEAEVYSASPMELVRMLYRAAIDSLENARQCLRNGDIEGRGKAVGRCAAIVTELVTSLDVQQGGEVARSLVSLYEFTLHKMEEGHLGQSDAPLAEAQGVLRTLLEGFAACETVADREPVSVPETGLEVTQNFAATSGGGSYGPSAYRY